MQSAFEIGQTRRYGAANAKAEGLKLGKAQKVLVAVGHASYENVKHMWWRCLWSSYRIKTAPQYNNIDVFPCDVNCTWSETLKNYDIVFEVFNDTRARTASTDTGALAPSFCENIFYRTETVSVPLGAQSPMINFQVLQYVVGEVVQFLPGKL